ncbi:dephospho-CoA kinase [Marinimicrobium sp. ABcell2]|uniref:dephospho-CoA kinase n=1 Tax=Marinimicrobium sp. ABcell2 TaxID=3069751 RepID=UPI0027B4D434|nr:dephospho-CoA kinase [Marinimicrobium sp. ABcell2]MDQ2077728.1 dephospho-CoA kinase [Marinimicrobium sp. ABcell2]
MSLAGRPKLLVGLTGGIGSGKSEVGRRFRALGITVVDADDVAREVVELGEPALADISAHFGPLVLTPSGALDRRKLRDIVFADPPAREWLEKLLHPLINTRIQQHLAQAESPYAVLVSPLLLETGQDQLVDRVLVVDAPEAEQVARVTRRDGVEELQIEAIMARQMPRQERLARAQDVIRNHQGLDDLQPQIQQLDQVYRSLAGQSG